MTANMQKKIPNSKIIATQIFADIKNSKKNSEQIFTIVKYLFVAMFCLGAGISGGVWQDKQSASSTT